MPRPITIPLAAGLQTELADQLVQPGSTLIMENCVADQTGKTRVRLGADELSSSTQATIPSGGTLPAVWQLAELGGSLVRFNRAPVPFHNWAPVPEAWVAPANDGGIESYRKGPIKVDSSPVFAGTAAVSNPDIAVSADTIVCVYRIDTGVSNSSGIRVTIMDRLSRRPIFTQRLACDAAQGGRVVISGTRAVVAYENGGVLNVVTYNLTSYTQSQTTTLGPVLNETPIDMRVGSPVAGASNVAILYQAVTSEELQLATVDATNLATNSTITPRTTAAAAVVPDLGFGWMQDLGVSGKFSIMIADTTDGLRTLWDLPAPTAGNTDATATHVLDASATAGLRNIIGTTITSSATGVYRVLYEVVDSAPVIIKVAVYNGSASTGTQFRFVHIRSKFWLHAGNLYLLTAVDAADQRTYFVMATAGDTTLASTTFPAPLAVSHPRDAGGQTDSTNAMSAAAVDADGTVYVGVTQETRTDKITSSDIATGGEERLLGIDVVRVRHAASVETELGTPAEYLKSLFVPGGGLGIFDGTTYGLAGFAYYPTGAGLTAQAGGDLETGGAYRYCFVYRFLDRNGRTWRSAPSTPVDITLTGGDESVEVEVPTLRLVDRGLASGHAAYSIEVYRTQANASAGFFMVAVVPNDPTVDEVTFLDNVADAALGEQLYTDGGGLENQLLPPTVWCVEHQGRIVVGEAGTGTMWYSTEADFQSGPIFNEALTFDVGDPSEPTTGAAVFNEQLFVFKAGKTYLVGGVGANALGQGQTYAFRLLDGSVGCENPQTIAVADDGVWFKASSRRAGIHRTGGGKPEYVGQGVANMNALTLTSAVVVRDKTEIRWYSEEGTTLVWNWTTKMWGTNTGQACLSAISGYSHVDGAVYANTAGQVLAEATTDSEEPYKEAGTTYLARIRTPWYQAAGLGGWERIRRMQGVGDANSVHKTVLNLYKNMSTSPFQTAIIDFPSARERWDWELRPEQQKYSALMIEVTIGPHVPDGIPIEPDDDDTFDGFDVDLGTWLWTFTNGTFTEGNVGDSIVIAGGDLAGSYTITHVVSPTQVGMTPNPGGGSPVPVDATTITLFPALVYTAGPGMIGIALVPIVKEGMDKLPSSRRAT